MKFTLKDYQEDAVRDVLANLADARDDYHRPRSRRSAFSLSAVTGAGKTVMAAAVLEALFNGNEDFGIAADPSAVVLWFTSDPSLNEQTRFRILQASDRTSYSQLQVIGNSLHEDRLEPGNVYFLNSQKLSARSLLVRGGNTFGTENMLIPPDRQGSTFWDVLRSTIEDPELTLYLILDEAHRGMKKPTRNERAEKSTIVRQLINGEAGAPAVPIVLGISATVDRFNEAMAESAGRVLLPNVEVDSSRVQESGLLKDDIRLHFPAKVGAFDTVLLRRGAREAKESARLWAEYHESQGLRTAPVVPLLVVQVPNTPSEAMLTEAVQAIVEEWPELGDANMAHVFGDHTDILVGGHSIRYISPEHVEERAEVRVLFAKDAISTGWDCPRAEVLVSYRSAKDPTHITQLLGRMVRTPLARRIPGNDLLNSVVCHLPFFAQETAGRVIRLLLGANNESDMEGEEEGGGSGGGAGRRVLTGPVDMKANPQIGADIWQAFDGLPLETLPRKVARPVSRLFSLAQALAYDNLLIGATRVAHAELLDLLDGISVRYATKLRQIELDIMTVEGRTLVGSLQTGLIAGSEKFTEMADDRAVEAEYRAAGRVLGREVAARFAERVADRLDDDGDEFYRAHVVVAALGRLVGVREELDAAANKLADKWFHEYRIAISLLPDERRAVYATLIAMSGIPQTVPIVRPQVRTESSIDSDGNPVPSRSMHLMADMDGKFPIGALGSWEREVLDRELPHAAGWYRNPSRSDDALAVAYVDNNGAWRRLFPDFVFFARTTGGVQSSIVDPHWHDLPDALPKLRGLSRYAEDHISAFRRIEAVSKVDNKLRVLDLTKQQVRSAVASASSAEELYRGSFATDY